MSVFNGEWNELIIIFYLSLYMLPTAFQHCLHAYEEIMMIPTLTYPIKYRNNLIKLEAEMM